MTERPDLAHALAAAAREFDRVHDLQAALDRIVTVAQRSLDGIDHVGITVTHRQGCVETRAATDLLVRELDQLQYETGEGPCLDAIREASVVLVEHLERDSRWPRFIPSAVALGLRAQMGLRLYVEEQTLGALNLYSTRSHTIPAGTAEMAELFATHAALALGKAREVENLNSALATRKVIGQAIGILMERYELDEDRAFLYLTRVSQDSNLKLRDIAHELVLLSNERHALPDGTTSTLPPAEWERLQAETAENPS